MVRASASEYALVRDWVRVSVGIRFMGIRVSNMIIIRGHNIENMLKKSRDSRYKTTPYL